MIATIDTAAIEDHCARLNAAVEEDSFQAAMREFDEASDLYHALCESINENRRNHSAAVEAAKRAKGDARAFWQSEIGRLDAEFEAAEQIRERDFVRLGQLEYAYIDERDGCFDDWCD